MADAFSIDDINAAIQPAPPVTVWKKSLRVGITVLSRHREAVAFIERSSENLERVQMKHLSGGAGEETGRARRTKLTDVLGLKPGMIAADIGADFGATTVVLGKAIEPGHLFVTDIGERQLKIVRDYVKRRLDECDRDRRCFRVHQLA